MARELKTNNNFLFWFLYLHNSDPCVRRCQSSLNQSSMGTKISDHIVMAPNKLSEEMIKCASAIYSDPHNGFSSPSEYDTWSLSFMKNFDDQFKLSGPYSSMIEVSHIHQNHRKGGRDLDFMNRNFSVDPRKLSHQEKLAFWINIHNPLCHALNGVPQNNGKRFLLLTKPAYNIGGRMVSVEAVQSYIPRIRMPRPGQWVKLLLFPRKFRTGDEHQGYSLDHSEPLSYTLLFIRVYTHKGIYQEIETAKEEYSRATFGVKKDQKLVLPKIIESFRKDSGLSQAALVEMIQECLPETIKKRVKKLCSEISKEHC
ncbi:hypothetical protein HID58_036102 [Brassica napus]|uniref:DUF547 domain-containing protein n=1 Tax=Brassica napus TaxID=3708 RepID=A0ABQ7X9B8_BRANA|nr:hypothetical protein HID58_094537 [Brassica napus]KAH0912781.1 hypothetical protein HID58_036102 [Brassica napus]